jgi:hypothetical protein
MRPSDHSDFATVLLKTSCKAFQQSILPRDEPQDFSYLRIPLDGKADDVV